MAKNITKTTRWVNRNLDKDTTSSYGSVGGTTADLTNYYTKSQSDVRYINAAGDTMTGDLNMGAKDIYLSDFGEIYFGDAAKRARIWSDGTNLTIDDGGGTAPLPLKVDGTLDVTGDGGFAGDVRIRTNSDLMFDYSHMQTDVGIKWWGIDNAETYRAGIVSIDEDGYRRVGIGFYTSDAADYTTPAELRMSILKNGNVGIGTTDPTAGYILDINGDTYVQGDLDVTNTTTSGKVHTGGAIATGSAAALQVGGFQRTGSIYLHEGSQVGTSDNGILSNSGGILDWDGGMDINGDLTVTGDLQKSNFRQDYYVGKYLGLAPASNENFYILLCEDGAVAVSINGTFTGMRGGTSSLSSSGKVTIQYQSNNDGSTQNASLTNETNGRKIVSEVVKIDYNSKTYVAIKMILEDSFSAWRDGIYFTGYLYNDELTLASVADTSNEATFTSAMEPTTSIMYGNVVIGATTPTTGYKLDVSGDTYVQGDLDVTEDIIVGVDIGSEVFSSGFAGSGWKYDDSGTRLTVDNLTVRNQLRVYELLIEQIRANRGAVVVSPGNAKIESNVSGTVTVDTGDDNRFPMSLVANDLIRCQRWNGNGTKYYVAKVLTVDVGAGTFTYEILDPLTMDDIEAGDEVVVFGNTTDTARQGLVYITASDDNAPYIDVLDGVSSDSLTGKTKVRLGKLDGIVDADAGLSGTQSDLYGLYSEDVYLKGHIKANTGDVGGFTVNATDGLYAGDGATRVQMKPAAGFWAGHNTQTSAPFYVTQEGALIAKNGLVGGWKINSDAIYTGTKKTTDGYSSDGVTLASNGSIHAPTFHLNSNGAVGLRTAAGAVNRVELDGTILSIHRGTASGDEKILELTSTTERDGLYGGQMFVKSLFNYGEQEASYSFDGIYSNFDRGSYNEDTFFKFKYNDGGIGSARENPRTISAQAIKTKEGTLTSSGDYTIITDMKAGDIWYIDAHETTVNGSSPRHISAVVKIYYDEYDDAIKGIITTHGNTYFAVSVHNQGSSGSGLGYAKLNNVQDGFTTVWTALRVN